MIADSPVAMKTHSVQAVTVCVNFSDFLEQTLINNLGEIVATGNDSRIPDFQQYYLLTPSF